MRALTFAAAALAVAMGAAAAAETLPAVGRLNHAGYRQMRHCTFTAVSPTEALTAQHCVEDLPIDEFHLLFGYARMAWVAEGAATATRRLGHDLAVLCLAATAPATIPLGPPPAAGDRVRVVGYGQPKAHLQHAESCTVKARTGDELLLDCAAPHGASGGPVLDGEGRLVGVMSRTSRAASIAAAVPADAADACGPPASAGRDRRGH